jgi:hypothetical protein
VTRSTRILCLLHFLGNAILLWLAYEWLWTEESSMARLGTMILVAVAIVVATAWLHGSALAHFAADDRSRLRPALGTALKHLLPLFVLALFGAVLYWALAEWDSAMEKATGGLKTVSDIALLLLRWLILPVLLLPLAGSVATKGFRGFSSGAWHAIKRWIYWVEVAALLFVGIWVPIKLIERGETHKPDAFGLQLTSLGARFFVAYLLFVVAWLLLESLTSGGKPRTSQATTASAP